MTGRASVSYSALYLALGRSQGERSILLLYNLLHSCAHFRNYLFVRACVPCARSGPSHTSGTDQGVSRLMHWLHSAACAHLGL